MASKSIMKRGGVRAFSLDLPMAALAAGSVAFIAWAMPNAFFAEAVMATGLPSLLPAAQPPLGDTARMAVVGAAALATFAIIFVFLKLLGRKAPARRAASVEPAAAVAPTAPVAPAAPRVRRADAHPDAPSRRPIFAEADLGEPFEAEAPPIAEPDEEVLDLEELARFARPAVEPEAPSIPNLMQRLELGLVRRGERPEPAAPEASEPSPFGDPVDRRLQSALANLQKMASRNH